MEKRKQLIPKGRKNIPDANVAWGNAIISLFNSEPLSDEFMDNYNYLVLYESKKRS